MSIPRLLLLSNSTQHGGKYLEYAREHVANFFSKYGVSKILFVPYAIQDYDKYAAKAKSGFEQMNLEVESIHETEDPVRAVEHAQGIFIGGGNTFLLLKTLYEKHLIEVIHKRVLKDGMPYMGASAGTNVATLSICTTNDMPICYPPSFSALKLVPFNINPHYIEPDSGSTHMGETRDERIKEYHCFSDSPPVLGLKEGCILLVEGEKAVLKGISGARLFQREKEPIWYKPEEDISFLLQ